MVEYLLCVASPLKLKILGTVVKSIVSLTNTLMTNTLTVVAKVFLLLFFCFVFFFCFFFFFLFFFSNTLISLLQNCYSHFFSIKKRKKNINVFAIFQDRNFNVTLANNFVKFWRTGPRRISLLEKQSIIKVDLQCIPSGFGSITVLAVSISTIV